MTGTLKEVMLSLSCWQGPRATLIEPSETHVQNTWKLLHTPSLKLREKRMEIMEQKLSDKNEA